MKSFLRQRKEAMRSFFAIIFSDDKIEFEKENKNEKRFYTH